MREEKDVNLKLWGRNPAGLDGDLRQQVTNTLVDVVDRRGQFHLPFLPVFQGEYHHNVKESMATPPLQKRMIGSLEDIGTTEPGYRSNVRIPETGMELPMKVGAEVNPLFAMHMDE
ncbi:MAG: hypothetical protein GY820_44545 [Gammaproteobacteria bacterium]|nr:hypothetical protein [Gammaproteobacteria bacterium]